MSRYQGLVALDGGSLEDAAHEYFLRSEQIRPGAARGRRGVARRRGSGPKHRWRAGGMLLQFLPKAPERMRMPDLHPGDVPEGAVTHEVAEDDAWVEGQSLVEHGRGCRTDRSRSVERAAGVPAVSRTRRARIRQLSTVARNARARATRVDAMLKSFAPGRPRRHGRERQDRGDLRVLLIGLPVHAA